MAFRVTQAARGGPVHVSGRRSGAATLDGDLRPTVSHPARHRRENAGVAQLGERLISNQNVVGSIPTIRSNDIIRISVRVNKDFPHQAEERGRSSPLMHPDGCTAGSELHLVRQRRKNAGVAQWESTSLPTKMS